MVVGGGGREHAIIKKIKENKKVKEIFALPGNGGIANDATCVDVKATDVKGVVDFALKTGIDYAVVAPDDPLVMGMVDALDAAGIPVCGCNFSMNRNFSDEDILKKFAFLGYKAQECVIDNPRKIADRITSDYKFDV